jgi:hypothetical protein
VAFNVVTAFRQLLWETYRRTKNVRWETLPTSKPYVSGDAFRNLTPYVLDRNGLTFVPSDVRPDSLIFIEAADHLIDYFFRKLEPWLKHPYTLISHNGDASMPGKQSHWLDHPKLKHWFSTNISCEHPKLTAIPIGILNTRFNPENAPNLVLATSQKTHKSPTAYVNFHVGGPTEKADYRHKRQAIYDQFAGKEWTVLASRVPPKEYLSEMAKHQFVVSPPGHGPDCYRHWEAMYLGSIPIVENSISMRPFQHYPMILIDKWQDVTPEFLAQQKSFIELRAFDSRKLYLDYWLDQVQTIVKAKL